MVLNMLMNFHWVLNSNEIVQKGNWVKMNLKWKKMVVLLLLLQRQ